MLEKFENSIVCLIPNQEYLLGKVPSEKLSFININEPDRIGNIEAENIDLAYIDFNSEELNLLKENNNGQISGNVITSILSSDNSYDYYGLNVSKLNQGNDNGLSLRTGICKIISSVRENAIRTEYAESFENALIEYPGSKSNFGTPDKTDSDFEKAYPSEFSGEDFKNEIRELFKAAGYEFDDEGNVKATTEITVEKKVSGKKKTQKVKETVNWKTQFTIAIPSYEIDNHVMMASFESIQNIFDSLGFTLEPKYFETTDEFILALQSKEYDIWMGNRNIETFDLMKYYGSNGKYNYYNFNSAELDELLNTWENNQTDTINTKEINKFIMKQGIEVPVYQKQHAVIYSTKRIEMDDVSFTEYFDLFDSLDALHIKE